MPLIKAAVDSLVARLRENDPTLTKLDLTAKKILELNGMSTRLISIGDDYIGESEWSQLVEAMEHNIGCSKPSLYRY